jgi:hypothetical protein
MTFSTMNPRRLHFDCIVPLSPATHSSSSTEPALARIEAWAGWFRLVLGLFLVFGLFHGSATMLASDRGQRGIFIGTLVVAATAGAEWLLLRRPRRELIGQLGLGCPRGTGIVVASGAACLLLERF